jgi:hypothetical protein
MATYATALFTGFWILERGNLTISQSPPYWAWDEFEKDGFTDEKRVLKSSKLKNKKNLNSKF